MEFYKEAAVFERFKDKIEFSLIDNDTTLYEVLKDLTHKGIMSIHTKEDIEQQDSREMSVYRFMNWTRHYLYFHSVLEWRYEMLVTMLENIPEILQESLLDEPSYLANSDEMLEELCKYKTLLLHNINESFFQAEYGFNMLINRFSEKKVKTTYHIMKEQVCFGFEKK